MQNTILIRGARVHNLKNISLELPRNTLIVMTGVSGSGKSSLAFDTIYAEGQRRYVESLSSYARQFLERMDKPDVDLIQGISPAMAIEQKTNTRNPRSTVGTTTEIYDYLRLLFARVGQTHCPRCGNPVTRDSVSSAVDALAAEASDTGALAAGASGAGGSGASASGVNASGANASGVNASGKGGSGGGLKLYVTFPLPLHQKETLADALANLQKEGFFRVIVDGNVLDLTRDTVPLKTKPDSVEVLVDRVVFRPGEEKGRIADSLETAFASGGGRAACVLVETGERILFNTNFECRQCHIPCEEPDPRLFSFNNPFGACPDCQGFGRAVGIDMDLVVPDREKSLRGGAIQPWTTPKFADHLRDLLREAPKAGVRVDVPFRDLRPSEVDFVLKGGGEFDGVEKFFRWVERKAYKIYYRVLLSRYRGYTTCPSCRGARLRPAALAVRLGDRTIAAVVQMTIAGARGFLESLQLSPYEQSVARRILEELRKRLRYLDDVGIGYLTLDRLSSTLSGGESQRINLATSLGSSLVGALYVLDEPSIGLHPRDNGKLIRILTALRDVGNTVLVVEHDPDMMRASDVIVDLGPGAGEQGGEVVYAGPLAGLLRDRRSLTGEYLSGRKSIPLPAQRRAKSGLAITIGGARHHNLRNIDVEIPLGMLVCVTGVSGSGKSTLVHDILHAGLRRALGDVTSHPGLFRSLEGYQPLSGVEMVDQSPIGRTPRSNPVTYIGVFDQIRALFAGTQSARVHGFKPGHFSFNVPGGRCEACEGDGVVKVEMQFLADLYLPCESCGGKRYKEEVLDVRYRGKNIDDVLRMTVSEAIRFFGAEAPGRRTAAKLKVLEDVGLGYIRLGQPATSLSGGEAQRVKLAAHLATPSADRHTLFLFDEPTTGLHFDDIAKLIGCFNALIDAGNSVVIIEHNLEIIKSADHVVDLGPDAGENGGDVVAAGTPEEIAANPASHTGRFLRPVLRP